jgi:hypothetical protein
MVDTGRSMDDIELLMPALSLANYYYFSTPSTGRAGSGGRASVHVTCIMHDELVEIAWKLKGKICPRRGAPPGAAPGWSRRPRGTMVHARPNGPMELRFPSRSRQSIDRARIPSSEVQT